MIAAKKGKNRKCPEEPGIYVKKSRAAEWIKTDAKLLAVAAVYYLILFIAGESCLIKSITGRECPCCGMTRALISLLKGDIYGYAVYNPLALPVAAGIYFNLHAGKGKFKTFTDIFTAITAVLVFARYINYLF